MQLILKRHFKILILIKPSKYIVHSIYGPFYKEKSVQQKSVIGEILSLVERQKDNNNPFGSKFPSNPTMEHFGIMM